MLKSLEKALYSLEKAPPANFPEKLLGSTLKHFLAYFDALTSPFLAPHELCDSTASMVFAAVRLVRENEFRLFFEEVVTWCWEIGKVRMGWAMGTGAGAALTLEKGPPPP